MKQNHKNKPPINEFIKATKVQLITHEGENLGVISKQEALQKAQAADLDLVMIAEKGKDGVPVTKIMDYGKVLYEKKKKVAESRKQQKLIQVKEIKMRPKIGKHDFDTKIKQAVQFLKQGKHVKISLVFRGRENITKKERGLEMFQDIENIFAEQDLTNIAFEKESKSGPYWSRIYFIKAKK